MEKQDERKLLNTLKSIDGALKRIERSIEKISKPCSTSLSFDREIIPQKGSERNNE